MTFVCLFFVTCLCSNLELANFFNNFLIDLSWPHMNIVHADKTEQPHGALTTWMTSGGWEKTGWLSSSHLIYHFKTQYKSNGCVLRLYNYWCESNISASSTCMSFFSNHMIMTEILQLGITSTLQQHYHVLEMVWNHGKTPYWGEPERATHFNFKFI